MSKRYADILLEDGYKRVSIWNMINLKRSNPRKYESIKDKIYSTQKRPENKCRMNFVFKDEWSTSFFRYNAKGEHLPLGEGHEESATHEAYKDIIASLEKLQLEIGGEHVILFITKAEIEYPKIINGNRYIIDVYFWFNKSIPDYYLSKWGGELAFEIRYKHKVSNMKEYDFNNSKFALFEHKISPKLLLENCASEEIEKKEMNFIEANYLSKKIYGKLISNPESEEYKEMKELEESRRIIISLREQLNEKNTIIENYNKQLIDSKNQIKEKEYQLFDLSGQLLAEKKEVERIKNTLGYKFFIRK